MCGEAYLIEKEYTLDAVGNSVPTETKRHILCNELSITRQEWAEAGRQGLNPAKLLQTMRVNYNGEDTVEYCGVKYSIYRVYEHNETIELYLERQAGI